MAYQALYRKFRPAEFQDVKGQGHIVETLKNQILADRVGHAYLFCGTRGTGKTTIAKIFAKSVNCENPTDGSPCGECAVCKAIASGSSMNVIEIDAASNNGVDSVREIIDEVSYSPTQGKYKVYIIDEAHMLSTGAFNALLKTLEEPPAYVIFILATTEAHRIPITIHSRCQRYDFKRIDIETIAARLQELMVKENIEVEDKALRYVAKMADGSLRDALSLLDQCLAFHYGEKLTYDMALDVLGAVDNQVFSRLLRHMIEQDVIGCINLLEEIVMQGRELTQFISDYTWYLRNLLLVKNCDNVEDVLDISTEHMLLLQEEAEMLEMTTVMRLIRIFSELSGQIRYAAAKRVMIEMAMIKACRPQMETDTESMLERIRTLEEKLEKGQFVVAGMVGEGAQVSPAEMIRKEKAPLPKAIPEDIQNVVNQWKTILGTLEQPLKTAFAEAIPSMEEGFDGLMVFLKSSDFGSAAASDEEYAKTFIDHICEYAQKDIKVKFSTYDDKQELLTSHVDLSASTNINMAIEEEEE